MYNYIPTGNERTAKVLPYYGKNVQMAWKTCALTNRITLEYKRFCKKDEYKILHLRKTRFPPTNDILNFGLLCITSDGQCLHWKLAVSVSNQGNMNLLTTGGTITNNRNNAESYRRCASSQLAFSRYMTYKPL